MSKFTVIPENTFDSLQVNVGVLLTTFDPSNPVTPADSAIICATTGGVNITCTPTFSDWGEDVDNCPANMKELKHLDSWDVKVTFTSLATSASAIKRSLGAADIDPLDASKIVPRIDLKQSDFAHLWWVGDRADGGLVAVKILNALSTGGFNLQTTKNGKGTMSFELTGHVSLDAQSVVPLLVYSIDPSGTDSYKVTQILSHVSSTFEDGGIDSGDALTAVLTEETGHTITNVIVTMGGVDVTATKYNSGTKTVSISAVTGDVIIAATANAS